MNLCAHLVVYFWGVGKVENKVELKESHRLVYACSFLFFSKLGMNTGDSFPFITANRDILGIISQQKEI